MPAGTKTIDARPRNGFRLEPKLKVNSRTALSRLGRDSGDIRFHPYPSQVFDLKGKEGTHDDMAYAYLCHHVYPAGGRIL